MKEWNLKIKVLLFLINISCISEFYWVRYKEIIWVLLDFFLLDLKIARKKMKEILRGHVREYIREFMFKLC